MNIGRFSIVIRSGLVPNIPFATVARMTQVAASSAEQVSLTTPFLRRFLFFKKIHLPYEFASAQGGRNFLMYQRDAKNGPQRSFSSERQLPVRSALNARFSTLVFDAIIVPPKAFFVNREEILKKCKENTVFNRIMSRM